MMIIYSYFALLSLIITIIYLCVYLCMYDGLMADWKINIYTYRNILSSQNVHTAILITQNRALHSK